VTVPARARVERESIERYAARLGVQLSSGQAERLHDFLGELDTWNRTLRLVGTRDRSRLITHHVVDSLAAAPLVASRSRVIDIGSGAGLPGIPLAISCPGSSFTLIDSRRRTVSFMSETVRRLGLDNVRIVEGRIEALVRTAAPGIGHDSLDRFDAAITRAWANLNRFLSVSAALLTPGGIAIAMKGPRAESEIERLGGASRAFEAGRRVVYDIEGATVRVLLLFEKL
jgi:16S rRNA (guanine527-N7)-methyltransferase